MLMLSAIERFDDNTVRFTLPKRTGAGSRLLNIQ